MTVQKKAKRISHQFLVKLYKDTETRQIVAEVPALSIADYGVDSSEALVRLQEMVHFHLECLVEEGKPIPAFIKKG